MNFSYVLIFTVSLIGVNNVASAAAILGKAIEFMTQGKGAVLTEVAKGAASTAHFYFSEKQKAREARAIAGFVAVTGSLLINKLSGGQGSKDGGGTSKLSPSSSSTPSDSNTSQSPAPSTHEADTTPPSDEDRGKK